MKFRVLTIMCFLLLLMIISIHAFSQEKRVLTHNMSIDLALKNNSHLKITEKELAKARAGIWEAYSGILPQLNASANFQHAWEIQQTTIFNFIKPMLMASPKLSDLLREDIAQMPDFIQMSFGLENTFVYGATVTQPLFLGGAGIAGIQMAMAGKRAAELNLEEQRQNLIHQTTNSFYITLLAKELIMVQEEALTEAMTNLDIVTKKYEAGSASGFDKMRAEVDVANLKPRVIEARNNYQAAMTNLKTVLGIDLKTVIDVEGQLEYVEDEFGNMPLADIKKLALENRPLMHVIDEQKYIGRKGVCLARSNFLPKLFFQTDYSYMAMKNNYDFKQGDFSKGFTSAVSLQIPLFQGFRSSAQYQKAKLDYNIIVETEKQISDGISAETEVVYNKFQEAKQKYASAKETVDLAKEALRLAHLMYEEGANTQLDVLNSQLALTQSKLGYLDSLFQYQITRYHLRKVTGQLKGSIG